MPRMVQITDAVRAMSDQEDAEDLPSSVKAAFGRLVKLQLLERAPPADLPLLPADVHPDAVVCPAVQMLLARSLAAWQHSAHLSKLQRLVTLPCADMPLPAEVHPEALAGQSAQVSL